MIRQACDWADIVHVYTPLFLSNAVINYCSEIGKPVTAAFHVQPENITSSFGLGKVRSITRFEQMLRKEIAEANVKVQTLSPERNEKQTLRSKGKRRNIA